MLLPVGQQHERHGVGQHGDDRRVAPGGPVAGQRRPRQHADHQQRQRPEGAPRERDPGRRDARLQRDLDQCEAGAPDGREEHEAGEPGQGRASVRRSTGTALRPGPARYRPPALPTGSGRRWLRPSAGPRRGAPAPPPAAPPRAHGPCPSRPARRASAPVHRPAHPRPTCGRGCGPGRRRPGLVDEQVPVGVCRDLRQVCHDHHLVPRRKAGQPAADLHRRPAADTGVDLVEDHGRHRVRAGQRDLEREHHARQLPARRAFAAPAAAWRRGGRPAELDLVDAVRTRREGRSPTAERRRLPARLDGV